MSATAKNNWTHSSVAADAPLELLRDERTAPVSHADTDHGEEEAFIWRTAAIGAVVGFFTVILGVTVAGLVVGLDAEKAIGLGGFLAFWGGGGFGFMISGLLSAARRRSHGPTGGIYPNPSDHPRGPDMTLQLGDTAPDFAADTTEGRLSLYEYFGDGWGILFSHPADFTPVCTTELGEFARRKKEFEDRNTRIIGVSVDSVESHHAWSGDIAETQGLGLNFPLIGDEDRTVATLYGMIHPNALDTATVRTVFVIGPDRKIKLTLAYPAAIGRNVDEILRALSALQLSAAHAVSTPVNWNDGDDVIISPAISDEDAAARFPKGFSTLKPYLRLTPQPTS